MIGLPPHPPESLRVLSDVVGAFADATIDYDRLLQTIARKLAETVGDLCSVLLLTDDGHALKLSATFDTNADVLAQARAAFSATPMTVVPVQRRVLDTGEALLIPRITADQIRDTTTDERARFTQRIGMHSVLLVALRARNGPVGVLNLLRHDPARPGYDDDDRQLAQTLADHAAVAIENARILRRQHDDLRAAKEAAESASRELEAFSYSVAHDLRAPLRAMRGFANALDEDVGDRLDSAAKHALLRIIAATERMGELIDALLGLSRVSRTPLERAPVDLSLAARGVLAQLQTADPTRVIDLVIADGLTTTGDPPLLRALLENLLGNAWKFTAGRPNARIEFGRAGQDRGVATFFVRDNGAGFDMAHAARMFTPFQRFHSEGEFAGTGIGLATVQRIVRRHGGRIWAESALHQGTTFWFTLDSAQGPPP